MTLSAQARRRLRLAFNASVLLLLAAGFGFKALGQFMAREDPLQKADALFVFAGTLAERPLEAADASSCAVHPTRPCRLAAKFPRWRSSTPGERH